MLSMSSFSCVSVRRAAFVNGDKEGDGDGDKSGGRATARGTKRTMVMAMRVASNSEGNGDDGKATAIVSRVAGEQQQQGQWQ